MLTIQSSCNLIAEASKEFWHPEKSDIVPLIKEILNGKGDAYQDSSDLQEEFEHPSVQGDLLPRAARQKYVGRPVKCPDVC